MKKTLFLLIIFIAASLASCKNEQRITGEIFAAEYKKAPTPIAGTSISLVSEEELKKLFISQKEKFTSYLASCGDIMNRCPEEPSVTSLSSSLFDLTFSTIATTSSKLDGKFLLTAKGSGQNYLVARSGDGVWIEKLKGQNSEISLQLTNGNRLNIWSFSSLCKQFYS